MKRTQILQSVLAAAMLVIGIASVAMWTSTDSSAESSHGGQGPWTIVAHDGSSGYLLNASTGETWHLRGNVKRQVAEYTGQNK